MPGTRDLPADVSDKAGDPFFQRIAKSVSAPWDVDPIRAEPITDKLKVLYLGFSDRGGGAAIASMRLMDRLTKDGRIRPLEIVNKKIGESDTTVSLRRVHRFPLWRRTWQAAEVRNRLLSDPYGWLPLNSAYISRAVATFKPDIIHCHNLHGGIGVMPITDMVQLTKAAPIIWTLHDMWPLTGHCAYSLGCDRWREGCGSCPDLSLYPAMLYDRTRAMVAKKRRTFERIDLTMVSPSNWLHSLVGDAPATRQVERRHIPNGIDLDVFRPVSTDGLRKRLGIPLNAPVLLFAAQSLDGDRRKGTLPLRDALRRVDATAKDRVHVLLMGNLCKTSDVFANMPNLIFHELGFVSDPSEIVRYFSAADLFLCPSLQDNLPNILIETHACATAAVTFDSGGCAEIVRDGQTGWVVPTGDTNAFADAILSLLGQPGTLRQMGAAAREWAKEQFPDDLMAQRYFALYSERLARRRA